MATYCGEIKTSGKNGFYVNFYPGYLLNGRSFEYLTRQDIASLLPGSQYLNINLISTSSSVRLDELFMDGDDILLDFEPEDLLPNLKLDGSRYPTAWKLDVSRNFGSTIRRMEDLGFYCLADLQDIIGDWQVDDRLVIDSPDINEGMEILIPIEEDQVFLGPLKVRYDEQSDELYVRTGLDGQKHVLSGYEFDGGVGRYVLVLEEEDVVRRYVETNRDGVRPYMIDRISDQELLENFKDLMSVRLPRQFRLDPDSAAQMIRIYQTSLLSTFRLSPDAARKRAETLQNMFDAQADFETALDNVSALAAQLLRNFSDQNVYRKVLEALSKDPEFLDQISSFREFSRLEEKKRREISRLEIQEQQLQDQVDQLAQMHAEQKIEEAQSRLDRLELLKNQAAAKLDEILEKTRLIQSLDDLKKQASFLEDENARKLQEIQVLENRLRGLEQDLNAILEQSSRKALEMSFDTLIAQKLTEETARKQREAETARFSRAARALAALPDSHLDPEQTVGLLVHSLQEQRAGFTKNMALNLLICLVQSPLTLLCGPAGSGKTTAVECAAAALGLNASSETARDLDPSDPVWTGRFVKLSVGRGWSSRRDWIGTYNPVSQTLEAVQPALFDLLSVLDIEARAQDEQTVLPALVLLDNANLSGMEYYWSDFLSASDNAKISTELQYPRGLSLQIPSWLHFAATIQNDHSSEPLSSRILDRAFVISMPSAAADSILDAAPSLSALQAVRLHVLQEAFGVKPDSQSLPEDLEEALKELYALFDRQSLPVSLRSRKAIRAYLCAALRWFEPEEDSDAQSVLSPSDQALDYVLLQRLMPSLSGSSAAFRAFLEELLLFAQSHALNQSKAKLEQMVAAGDEAMQYYQFFEA